MIESARQFTLRLTSLHAHAAQGQRLLTDLSLFLTGHKNTAEQLSASECWERMGKDFNSAAVPEESIGRSQRVSWEPQDKEPAKSAPTVRLKTAPQAESVFYCRI